MKPHKEFLLEQAKYGLDFIERMFGVDENELSELRVVINIHDVAYVTSTTLPDRQLVCTKDGVDAWKDGDMVKSNVDDLNAYLWLISKVVVIKK